MKDASQGVASSSTSTTGRRRKVRKREASREVDDDSEVYCHHGVLARRWTSWTELNLSRRFYGCRNYSKDDDCGFFAWHDGEFGKMANDVMKELLNEIDKMYDENTELRKSNGNGRFDEELGLINGEVRKLKTAHDARESEMRKVEKKFRFAMGVLLITWVWLIVLYTRSNV